MTISSSRRRSLRRLGMVAGAIALFLIAYYWGNQYKLSVSSPPPIEAILIRPAPAVAKFELHDETGQPFTADNLNAHWTLLSFGDLSQASGHLAVTRMIEVYNRLAGDTDVQSKLQLLLAAQRQKPDLAQDFSRLSPVLRLLSGTPEEVQRLRASVGAPVAEANKTAADAAPNYLIGPAGRLLSLFPAAQAPASIASDLSAIAKHSNSLFPADD